MIASQMKEDKHSRMVRMATRLHSGWILGVAVLGKSENIAESDLKLPIYEAWENKRLKRQIGDLEASFDALGKHLLLNWSRSQLSPTSTWLAKRYADWVEASTAVFDLGRVHEIEAVIGPLGHRRFMDCPPYAQVLLQGFHGAAIRHPEYHLASDLALIYNLFLDSEQIIEEAQRAKRLHTSEHSQSLGRSVILTCFNLLESFVSGLASAFLLENPNAPDVISKKLSDNGLSFRKRLLLYPNLVTGKTGTLDETKPPLKLLLDECKQRRDSFVHCEPGPTPTKWGYVKEQEFHSVDLSVVERTVDLTCEAICLIWKLVHGSDKPSWLPERGSDGRFPHVRVRLQPLETDEFRIR